uniref:TLC domain-containing protein n=1 Tax=Rhodosorus marinus TaxID=101924 RepID=A0A7S0G8J6_9RHOD|mmetsp:Transcript_853/g.1280  ORF Transcript_853/g.1280 Transcript_853/m.1280 type:complete len:205 (+) Transcript_853:93-707(+)
MMGKVVEMWEYLTPFERHDYFNIFTLTPVSVMCLLAVERAELRRLLFICFALYTLADCGWIVVAPKSVKDSSGILLHHALALLLLGVPILYPEYSFYGTITLSVELNTWLLITKRHVFWRPLRLVLDALFYVSWVVIRLIFYPYLLSRFVLCAMEKLEQQIYTHPVLLVPIYMSILCFMQFKWTWEIVKKNIIGRPQPVERKTG